MINAFKQEQQPAATVEDDDFPPPEISTHLIELFFQYINSVFPFVHRGRLKQSIQDGNVSKPLLWGVMAIAARLVLQPIYGKMTTINIFFFNKTQIFRSSTNQNGSTLLGR